MGIRKSQLYRATKPENLKVHNDEDIYKYIDYCADSINVYAVPWELKIYIAML